MIYSLKGKIVDATPETVAVDLGSIAYEVFVSRPGDFPLGEEKTIYCHEVMTQDDHYLCGFSSRLEKDAFASLIQVKGIGPKTALGALSKTNPEELFQAISANNVAYLKKLPGIGPKAAAQIILDLKGRLVDTGAKGNPEIYDEVKAALKSLGFKIKEIDDVLASINTPDLTNEEVLREALKKLRKK